MSRQLFIVNDPAELTDDMSTTQWMDHTQARGGEVWAAAVDQLDILPDGQVAAQVVAWRGDEGRRASLAAYDAVIIRTNPARDPHTWRHDIGLQLLAQAADDGVLILNDPRTLLRARSKVYLSRLPRRTVPQTLVSRDAGRIRGFVATVGTAVIKPVVGTHGTDVFVLDGPDASNFGQIVEVVTRGGFAMVQEFIPEAALGDVRVLMVDGEPLMVDGEVAAVRRVPGLGDFRSNVHAGGHAARAEMTPSLWEVARAVGPVVREDGLFLVGLDVIGDKVVEVNTFAPGGFPDAGRFAGKDFLGALCDAVERRIVRASETAT